MNVIGNLKLLSKTKQRELNKYIKLINENNIIIDLIDVRIDGYILKLSYNDKTTIIEEDILTEILPKYYNDVSTLIAYINIRSKWYMNSINLNKYLEIPNNEIYENISHNGDVYYTWLKKVIYFNGKYMKPKTYEEYYIDIRKNNRYRPKKTYLKSEDDVKPQKKYIQKYFVYRFLNKNDEIVYVGKTIDLYERMNSHFKGSGHLSDNQYNQVVKVEYINCDNEADMSVKEFYFINKYKPPFNTYSLYQGDISNEVYDDIIWKNILDNEEVM